MVEMFLISYFGKDKIFSDKGDVKKMENKDRIINCIEMFNRNFMQLWFD